MMQAFPEMLAECDEDELEALVRSLSAQHVEWVDAAFPEWAHPGQLAPAGDWRTWVLLAGRGFGKTRAGAEWVLGAVRLGAGPLHHPLRGRSPSPSLRDGEDLGRRRRRRDSSRVPPSTSLGRALHHPADGPPLPEGEDLRIALVAATVDEARRVMVEGASGLLACARAGEIADWSRSRGELRFASGAVATLYSGANPESLRGPQHHLAWCDELAKWRHAEAAWDMLALGLRCGVAPRALVTTTPRGGCAALKRILAAQGTVLTGGSSRDNPHLPAAFLEAVEAAYGGTRMGREELDGELLDDVHGSLWPVALLERSRGVAPCSAALRRVVVGVDPPASAGGTCGIVACGLDAEGVGWVLADHSEGGLSPEGWARKVATACEVHGADRIVAERNQGGDMVTSVLRAAGIGLPVTPATAAQGKVARAEPVAGLFESGKARLAGRFVELEAELGGLVPEGYAKRGAGKSPDRADAMVWALWALLLAPKAEPRVRVL